MHELEMELAAKRFNIDVAALTPLTGGHSALVYGYSQAGQDCVLKLVPPDAGITLADFETNLDWQAYLASTTGAAVQPLPVPSGGLVEVISVDGQDWLAVVFNRAAGMLAERLTLADWDDNLFAALGQALGRCHAASRTYGSEADRRPEWHTLDSCFNPISSLPGADPAVLAQWETYFQQAVRFDRSPATYGLTHMDLHFGNFFVDLQRQQITFFDFDDFARGWYVMDIAMLLFDVLVLYRGDNRTMFGKNFLRQLLRGYARSAPVTLAWAGQLPVLLKLVESGVYLMSYRHYDGLASDDWLGWFMPGRRQAILDDRPYVDLDFERLVAEAMQQGA